MSMLTALVLSAVLMQTPPIGVTGLKFAWAQAAPTLQDAGSYTYKYYADGATTGTTITSVSCSGSASPFACETPIPAFTPGSHTIALTASNLAGESEKSALFSFTFVVTPAAPGNISIK
jgi:hypothetical protein